MSPGEQELLEILRVNVILLRHALLVGHPAPIVERMLAATSSPRPGDLVIEESTIYRPVNVRAVGILLRTEREPMYTADQWDEEAEGQPIPTERVFYIRDLDGVEHRWVNARFMRIALSDDDQREIRGEPELPSIYSREQVRQGRIDP